MEYFSRNGHADRQCVGVHTLMTPVGAVKTPWAPTDLPDDDFRLGYVDMPLVLAAIDLKISPSHEEMTARQRRLDALSGIICHSENLYDVTDFVAAGTNHILHLAYVIIQNLFLRWAESGHAITTVDSPYLPHARKNDRYKNGFTGSRTYRRAKCWLDAFLQSPRAYLLISTSVDYSLAVGRLPYYNALPDMVRYIPALWAVSQLPWAVHAHHDDFQITRRRRCLHSRTQSVASHGTVKTIPEKRVATPQIAQRPTQFALVCKGNRPNSPGEDLQLLIAETSSES